MTLQNVVIFGLGAVAGAAAASIVLKDKYKKKYEALYKDELESYRESFEKMRKSEMVAEAVQNSQYMGKAGEVIQEAGKKLNDRMNYASIYSKDVASKMAVDEVSKLKRAYDYIAESESPSEDESYEDTLMRKVNEGKQKKTEPKIIREDEFDNEYQHHSKVTLLYFTYDGVLAEELSGEEVDDVNALIGDALDKYNFRNNDEKVIYVRNMNRGADYEICKVEAAYADEGGY